LAAAQVNTTTVLLLGLSLTLAATYLSACTSVAPPFAHLELKTLNLPRQAFAYRLNLVGDAGEPKAPEPALECRHGRRNGRIEPRLSSQVTTSTRAAWYPSTISSTGNSSEGQRGRLSVRPW
jgi:hypothetical protein